MASLPLSWPHGTVLLFLTIGCITLRSNAENQAKPAAAEPPSCCSAGGIHAVSLSVPKTANPMLLINFTICSGCDVPARGTVQPTRKTHSSYYLWPPAGQISAPPATDDCVFQIEINRTSNCSQMTCNNVSQQISAASCRERASELRLASINLAITGDSFCARSSLTASTCSANVTVCPGGTPRSKCKPRSVKYTQENCPPVPHTNSTAATTSPATPENPKTMALAPETISPTFGSTSSTSSTEIAEATQRVDGGSNMTITLVFLIVVSVALLAENFVLVCRYRKRAIKITRDHSHVSPHFWSRREASDNEQDLNNVVYANHTADSASTTSRNNGPRSVVRPTMLAVGSPAGPTTPDVYAFPHDMIDSDSRSVDMLMTLAAGQRGTNGEDAHYQLPLDRIAAAVGCGATEAGNEHGQPPSSDGSTLLDHPFPREGKLETTVEQAVCGQHMPPKCNASVNQQGAQTTASTTDSTYEAICGTGDDSATDSPANRSRRPYATICPGPTTGHHGRESALRRGQTGSFENSIYDGTGEIEIAFNIYPTAEP